MSKILLIHDGGINSIIVPWVREYISKTNYDELWCDLTMYGNRRIIRGVENQIKSIGILPYRDILSLERSTFFYPLSNQFKKMIEDIKIITTRATLNRFEDPIHHKIWNRTLAMKAILDEYTEDSVLIVGWSGTLKSLAIHAIRKAGQRKIDFLLLTDTTEIGDRKWMRN